MTKTNTPKRPKIAVQRLVRTRLVRISRCIQKFDDENNAKRLGVAPQIVMSKDEREELAKRVLAEIES